METLTQVATAWWAWIWAGFWQVALLVVLIGTVDRLVGKRIWPQLRLALWSLVLIKLIVPPGLFSPLSLTSGFFNRGATPYLIEGVAYSLDSAVPLGGGAIQQVVASATELAAAGDGRGRHPGFQAWTVGLMAVWLGVAVLLGVAYVMRLRRFRAQFLADHSRYERPAWLEQMVKDVAAQVGVRRAPTLIVTERIACPAVFGPLRPLLLVPVETLRHLSRDDVRNILIHELAHVKRRDLHVQALGICLQIIYWFNPLVYLVRRQIHETREVCCDATVAEILRDSTRRYRQTLLDAAARLMQRPVPGLEAVSLMERPGNLVERLRRLDRARYGAAGRRRIAAASFALAAVVFVLPMGRPDFVNRCQDRGCARERERVAHADETPDRVERLNASLSSRDNLGGE